MKNLTDSINKMFVALGDKSWDIYWRRRKTNFKKIKSTYKKY